MLALATEWAGQYRADHPGSVLKVRGGGSGLGLSLLLDGGTELAMAARPALPRELELATQNGITLQQHCVVRNVAAICVHRDSVVQSLTLQQLAQIFGVDRVTKWSELGFAVPETDDDIVMATHKRGSASYGALRTAALRGKEFAHSRIAPENDDALIAYAAITKGAIVAIEDPEAVRGNADVKLLAIAQDAASPPCLPSAVGIADGSYPLVASMFVYSRKDAGPQVAMFLRWLSSDAARDVTAKYGYRPSK